MNNKYAVAIFVFLLAITILLLNILDISGFRGKSRNFSPMENVSGLLNSSYDTEIKIGDKKIYVEVLADPGKMSKGLSNRKTIGDNQGMLFDFGYDDTYPNFWMKDMKFAIDIIWINDSEVIGIEKNIQPEPNTPYSELATYRPIKPVDYVLEVKSGFSDKNNIDIGTEVDLENAINSSP